MTDTTQAAEILRQIIKPSDTIYTTLLHVSQSGMSRDISLLVAAARPDGTTYIHNISGLAAKCRPA